MIVNIYIHSLSINSTINMWWLLLETFLIHAMPFLCLVCTTLGKGEWRIRKPSNKTNFSNVWNKIYTCKNDIGRIIQTIDSALHIVSELTVSVLLSTGLLTLWFVNIYHLTVHRILQARILEWDSLVAQTVNNLSAMQETWVWSLGWEDPLKEEMASTPVFWPGEFHGQRSLAGYSPWGHKEWDKTEQLMLSLTYHEPHNPAIASPIKGGKVFWGLSWGPSWGQHSVVLGEVFFGCTILY